MPDNDDQLAREAKAIVAMAFRNGPIERIHAGKECPTCDGSTSISRITQEEMKDLMKTAVNRVYTLLQLRDHEPETFRLLVTRHITYAAQWDDPDLLELYEL